MAGCNATSKGAPRYAYCKVLSLKKCESAALSFYYRTGRQCCRAIQLPLHALLAIPCRNETREISPRRKDFDTRLCAGASSYVPVSGGVRKICCSTNPSTMCTKQHTATRDTRYEYEKKKEDRCTQDLRRNCMSTRYGAAAGSRTARGALAPPRHR